MPGSRRTSEACDFGHYSGQFGFQRSLERKNGFRAHGMFCILWCKQTTMQGPPFGSTSRNKTRRNVLHATLGGKTRRKIPGVCRNDMNVPRTGAPSTSLRSPREKSGWRWRVYTPLATAHICGCWPISDAETHIIFSSPTGEHTANT